ncbi:DUF2339 domain-containing protein [Sulfurimonas sp.]|uniref:DUF2339 domain-containing protein n=1 Tax=Sulfurimonas sp. TaxID=2022749 RepID=UPI003D118E0C
MLWLISIIILGIIFFVQLANFDFENALAVGILMFIITIFKLLLGNKTLSDKVFILEKKLEALEKKFEQGIIHSQKEETETKQAKVTKSKALEVEKTTQTTMVEAPQPLQQKIQPTSVEQEQFQKTIPQIHPNPIEIAIRKLITYFTIGNPLVKIGGVILFFGLSFLIKFAVNNDMVSVEFGLLSVMIFAIGLIGVGYKHRKREGYFGLILQGIGIAVFYLAIFSAAKFFSVIPFSVALGIMIITVIFATLLAIIQDAFYLAIFATAGGFLAPILTSTGDGSHIVLFSYYALLNLSIAIIAWYKSWRVLNLIGFAFTFIIGTLWGVTKYQSEFFATTEPFLILFFLLYVVISVFFAHRTTFKLKAYVDSALVFGVPSVAFGLQASISEAIPYLLAYSSLGAGAIYISLAWWLRNKEKFSLLAESFLALGIIFLSLVFAFALSPEISAVIYALESSAVIWISLRQDRLYARIFALGLEAYAVVTYINENINYFHSTQYTPFLNKVYLGYFILSIATLLSAFVYEKYKDKTKKFEHYFHIPLLILGLLLWIGSGFDQVSAPEFGLIFLSISALIFMFIATRYTWQTMNYALELFLPISLLLIVATQEQLSHMFAGYNLLAIPLFFVVLYTLLYKVQFKLSYYWHAISLWAMMIILSLEMFYHIKQISFTIAYSTWPLVLILAVYIVLKQAKFWPLTTQYESYKNLGIAGLSVMMLLWEVGAFLGTASLKVIPYIPLLNPLELMQVSVIITLLLWLKSKNIERSLLLKFIAGASLIFITIFWARLVHYYGDIPYNIDTLLRNGVFQTGISIIYTLIALAIISYSKRKQSRPVWIVGAALLGTVIFKLIIADMAQRDSLERIISFLVVGVLILVIGYIAPLPPKKEEQEKVRGE